MEDFIDITWDAESSNLLNDESIDYTQSPYRLRDSYSLHCIVVEEHQTGNIIAFYDGDYIPLDGTRYEGDGEYTETLENYTPMTYIHKPLAEFEEYVKAGRIRKVVAHNGINFDHLLVKLWYGLDYTVVPDTFGGHPVQIEDTLVTSKTLNPDRFGGHSLDVLGKKVGLNKIEFRKSIKKDKRFVRFAPDMLYYCIRDVQVNTKVFFWLEEEKGDWDWTSSLDVEKAVKEIITRQEHRGFDFDSELAERNVKELDTLKEEARQKVEPLLPDKVPTKGFMKTVTPPSRQINAGGKISSFLRKFVEEKHGGSFKKVGDSGVEQNDYKAIIFDKEYFLPLPEEPLIKSVPCSVDDSTEIKTWIVSHGWVPSEWAERDLTMYADKKKGKLPDDKFVQAVDRYVEQTLNSPLQKLRLEKLNVSASGLRAKLLNHKRERPLKVRTNPKFTVGQEKEICPNLELMSERFPFIRDVLNYLTYKHRRNSILGGGLDWDDEGEASKGYLAYVRSDGRVPTPADSCGTSTSRFTHKIVANIPRVSSLYGKEMRGLFGVTEDFFQIGYDFDSLEAREEAHYCWRWESDEDKTYCNSLLLAKPNDVHTSMARKISAIINKAFSRTPAKAVKYAATYGATAPKIAATIGETEDVGNQVYNAFWDAAEPLKILKEKLKAYWEKVGGKKFILGIDGRKVPTRSAHSILNTLFQSAGVICAKRAMVIHDRLLKQEGLLVDFFKEDWKNKTFCQQLVAYHDESQLEVNRSMVKFKTVRLPDMSGMEEEEEKETRQKVEAEITQIKEELESSTGNVWSDVGHSDKAYYVAYCRAGELAVKAVKEAGQFYNLNVDLTAGYMVGRNWAECH